MDENKFPLVSILIPAYNQTIYLKKAIESAINQTYQNTEIIIGDDSSDDDVRGVVNEYISKYSNIRYYNNGGPLGQYGVLNCENILSKANGDYISFLYHDDEFYPTKIEKMINKFTSDNSLALVTSSREVINENGEVVRIYDSPYNKDNKIDGKEFARKILYTIFNFVGEPTTVMFKKSDVINIKVGVFDYIKTSPKCLVDVALFLKLCSKGNVYFLKEPLSKFRIHQGQNSSNYSIIDWSPIDFFNMIIDSYEVGLFINGQEELIRLLEVWKSYYWFMMHRAIRTCKASIENENDYKTFICRLDKYNVRLEGIEL